MVGRYLMRSLSGVLCWRRRACARMCVCVCGKGGGGGGAGRVVLRVRVCNVMRGCVTSVRTRRPRAACPAAPEALPVQAGGHDGQERDEVVVGVLLAHAVVRPVPKHEVVAGIRHVFLALGAARRVRVCACVCVCVCACVCVFVRATGGVRKGLVGTRVICAGGTGCTLSA
jgi:hypothetical protein